MIDLYALDRDALTALLKQWGQPAFRAKQVWHWLHDKGVSDPREMHNLPQSLQERLCAETQSGTLEVAHEQYSQDGTIKRLYRLSDGQLIESCLLYTSPSPRDKRQSRMPSSA